MVEPAGRPTQKQITPKLFVRHGDEARAVSFFETGLGAQLVQSYNLPSGRMSAAELKLGGSVITVVGANPARDANPNLGGPRSISALGTTPFVLELSVDDADRAISRALQAGATLRNAAVDLETGGRVGVVIDPFGQIWALKSDPVLKDSAPRPEKVAS